MVMVTILSRMSNERVKLLSLANYFKSDQILDIVKNV